MEGVSPRDPLVRLRVHLQLRHRTELLWTIGTLVDFLHVRSPVLLQGMSVLELLRAVGALEGRPFFLHLHATTGRVNSVPVVTQSTLRYEDSIAVLARKGLTVSYWLLFHLIHFLHHPSLSLLVPPNLSSLSPLRLLIEAQGMPLCVYEETFRITKHEATMWAFIT